MIRKRIFKEENMEEKTVSVAQGDQGEFKNSSAYRKKRGWTRYIFPVTVYTGVALWVLIFLVLVLWSFSLSVKTVVEYYNNRLWFPRSADGWDIVYNYTTAIKALNVTRDGVRYDIGRLLFNSLLYAVGSGFFSVLTACLASYVLAKYSYLKWVRGLWVIVLITNYMPIGASLAATIKMMNDLNLYDSMLGMYFYQCGAFGYIFLIYYASWKSVSWSYAEAAFIDGAGHFRTMWQVMWPMTVTIFGVLFLNQFIGLWNDYMTPLIYLPSYPNMSYGAWLFQFNTENPDVAIPPIQIAGLLSLAFPIFILFLIFRNKLMGSLTLGGLKG